MDKKIGVDKVTKQRTLQSPRWDFNSDEGRADFTNYISIKADISDLKNKLNLITDEENLKRTTYNQFRNNLQEAWDKLVNLRAYILNFQRLIESVTLEEAKSYTLKHSNYLGKFEKVKR
jgi:hypothetical protein